MNNERPIEQLLRRHARKCREDAGAPLEMHPATRRLLHGEVTRRFGKTGGKTKGPLALLSTLLVRRWAYVATTFMILALTAAMWLPTLSKSGKHPELAMSSSPVALTEREIAPPVASTLADNREADVKSVARLGRPVNFETTAPGGTAAIAANEDAPAARDDESSMLRPTVEPAASQPHYFAQSFANVAPHKVRGKAAKSASLAAISPVLANFRVEQSGRQLRVVDADGSMYLGDAWESPAGLSGKTDGQTAPAGIPLQYETRRDPAPAPKEAAATPTPDQSLLFRVVGTNRTLNQAVVFTWNFVEVTNPPASTQSWNISNAPDRTGRKAPALLPVMPTNAVINGRARIGGGGEIEINAVPVPP